jgi:hypothetical protein
MVRLPVCSSHKQLGDSLKQATQFPEYLQIWLNRQPHLREKYANSMEEYAALGIHGASHSSNH